jgi:hypothetical protein
MLWFLTVIVSIRQTQNVQIDWEAAVITALNNFKWCASCLVLIMGAVALAKPTARQVATTGSSKRVKPEMTLILMDDKIDANKVRKQFPKVSVYSRRESMASTRGRLLQTDVQANIFKEAGLWPQLKSWDQFDRDRLLMRLRYMDPAGLQKIYKMPRANFETAQASLKKIDSVNR